MALSDIHQMLIFVLVGQGALLFLLFVLMIRLGPVSGRLQGATNVLHDIADELERLRRDLALRKE